MRTHSAQSIPAEVRAAISAFLNASRKEDRPIEASEAVNAVRRVFPDLDIPDAALMDAITSEASAAGFGVEANAGTSPILTRNSPKQRDDEGGAVERAPRTYEQRRVENGARRRAQATKDRNELI
jgi:hypothetical protein